MIHKTAEVSPESKIGKNVKIWNNAQVREKAEIGDDCIISKNVYVDFEVKIGNKVKIGNNVSVFNGVTIEDGVMIGPHVTFTNDLRPRAINPDGTLKGGGTSASDWTISKTLVKMGAGIGANSTILPVVIGQWALIGAGCVVTKNVPDHGLVVGVPARLAGFVCKCGFKLEEKGKDGNFVEMKCTKCSEITKIPLKNYLLLGKKE
jgi:UDP-2-acetamido-3-amino-2,3-dideoxy-glucuronate N-acetyltransferase